MNLPDRLVVGLSICAAVRNQLMRRRIPMMIRRRRLCDLPARTNEQSSCFVAR